MKNRAKRIAALILAVVMVTLLSACGSGKVTGAMATSLVQGNLDEIYLGKFDESYLKLVDSTVEEAEQIYISGLETEAEYFADYFTIEYLTDDIKAEIVDLYKDIYAKSKYTVNEASKLDDNTYAVKVQVEPINIFQLVAEDYESYLIPFWEKYADADIDAMTEAEYQAYDADWAEAIIAMCRDKVSEIGYMDEKSVVIQVEKNDDGVWSMSGDDFSNFDEIIIYY
ncbi:MAG: hypothetical protein ACI3VB_04480 [Oscillospiraceae bacterium]